SSHDNRDPRQTAKHLQTRSEKCPNADREPRRTTTPARYARKPPDTDREPHQTTKAGALREKAPRHRPRASSNHEGRRATRESPPTPTASLIKLRRPACCARKPPDTDREPHQTTKAGVMREK